MMLGKNYNKIFEIYFYLFLLKVFNFYLFLLQVLNYIYLNISNYIEKFSINFKFYKIILSFLQ